MADVKYTGDGMTYVGWLEDAVGTGIPVVSAPDLSTDLVGIVDLSCHITSGGLDLGVSTGTVDTGSLCSDVISQAVGRTTISPTLTMWRYKQPDDTAWDLVEKGTTGWLVIREGKASDAALAAGDQVIVAFVEMGEPGPEFAGGDTAKTFMTNFVLVNGAKYDPKAVIVA
jgi:hypothetical protein